MIKVQSFTWGEIECKEEHVLTFPKGIPGFTQLKQYVLLQPDPQTPFYFLQPLDTAEVDFMLADPFLFYPHYEFELSESIQHELNITSEEQVQIFCIVSVEKDIKSATINLLAPLVINTTNRKAMQVILHQSSYQTKHPLWSELQGE